MKHITAYILLSALCSLLSISCVHDDEQQARLMLGRARVELAAGNYEAAKSTIKEMRSKYPKALVIRREALLFEDSLNYIEAQNLYEQATTDEMTEEYALRKEFYLKKLQHDAEAIKK